MLDGVTDGESMNALFGSGSGNANGPVPRILVLKRFLADSGANQEPTGMPAGTCSRRVSV